jgi:FHA domain
MADRNDALRRQSRAPLQSRSRRRWAVAAGLAGLWAFLLADTGSLVAGTALLLLLAAFVTLCMVALRGLGMTRDHPWVQRLAARPWRDGRDVLGLGLRHLADVFVVTPTGSLLAPNVVELRMNLADFGALTELIDLALINSSATEAYQAEVAARAARLASAGPVEAFVIGDPAVPAGRYQLRQGRAADPALAGYPVPAFGYAAPAPGYAPPPPASGNAALPVSDPAYQPGQAFAHAHDGRTELEQDAIRTAGMDPLTIAERVPVPLLRLLTGGSVAETRSSGARAGRGTAAELRLPDEPTVSRVHAKFTFSDGQWWITSLGRNGVALNGSFLADEHALRDGDSIRWGSRPDAMASRVEIG